MARMYSHEAVMKLLETQRKSIMEFEAAKYELMMGGEQKPVEAVSEQKPVDWLLSPDKLIRTELIKIKNKWPEEWTAFYTKRFNHVALHATSDPHSPIRTALGLFYRMISQVGGARVTESRLDSVWIDK